MKQEYVIKILSFFAMQAAWFGVLYLTLSLYSKSDFTNRDDDLTIKIVGNTKETLELEQDKVDVKGGRKVTWLIDGDRAKNVKTFSIETKSTSEHAFKWFHREPRSQTRNGNGRLKNLKKNSKVVYYVYSVIWFDTLGNEHPFDPKIAVKPGSSIPFAEGFLADYPINVELLTYILYSLGMGLITLLTYKIKFY